MTRTEDDTLVFQFEGETAAVSLLAEPMPPEDPRGGGGRLVLAHRGRNARPLRAQILVGVLPDSGDRVESALRLTKLAAATADASRGEGRLLAGRRAGPLARRDSLPTPAR